MIFVKKCRNCGLPYETYIRNSKFCSEPCKLHHRMVKYMPSFSRKPQKKKSIPSIYNQIKSTYEKNREKLKKFWKKREEEYYDR